MAATDIPLEAARRFDSVLGLALRARPRMLSDAARAGLNRDELEVGEVDTLEQIALFGPSSMSEVASGLQVGPSTVTRSVDRLVERGLVSRERSCGDARVVLVSVTDEGRAAQAEASERRTAFACRLLEHLHPDDQDAVGRLWPVLGQAIGNVLGVSTGIGTCSESGAGAALPGDRHRRNGAALGVGWRAMRRAKPGIVALAVGGRFEPPLEAGDVDTLDLVAAADGLAQMSDVATGLGIAASTASHAVGRLVDRGFVARDRDAADGRVFRVSLTVAGRQAHEITREGRLAFARQVVARFEPVDQAVLHRLLPLIAEAVKREFVGQASAESVKVAR